MPRPKLGSEKSRPLSITVRISADHKRRLAEEAARRGVSIGDIISEAILKHWEANR